MESCRDEFLWRNAETGLARCLPLTRAAFCLPQGSVYQKTNAMSEIKRVNKDNFWAKAEVGAAAFTSAARRGWDGAFGCRQRFLSICIFPLKPGLTCPESGIPTSGEGGDDGWVGKWHGAGLAAEILLPGGARGGGIGLEEQGAFHLVFIWLRAAGTGAAGEGWAAARLPVDGKRHLGEGRWVLAAPKAALQGWRAGPACWGFASRWGCFAPGLYGGLATAGEPSGCGSVTGAACPGRCRVCRAGWGRGVGVQRAGGGFLELACSHDSMPVSH